MLDGGLLTTIQDSGRAGYRKYGIPVAGVMDSHACKLANWLVGNPEEYPVLEITLQGGKFKFQTEAVIGISGAEAEVLINEKKVSLNKTIFVNAGDILTFGRVKTGCRGYMAIRGKWEIEKVMGSYSTCLAAKFGGFGGRSLAKGDFFSWVVSKLEVEIKEEKIV